MGNELDYLNGLSVSFHIWRELVRSIENVILNPDEPNKLDKIQELANKNLKAIDDMLNRFKSDVEFKYKITLKINNETKEYEIGNSTEESGRTDQVRAEETAGEESRAGDIGTLHGTSGLDSGVSDRLEEQDDSSGKA
jgi:hypothetical protein